MMPVGWRLWLWWVLASTVGWVVGGYVGAAVAPPGDIIVTVFLAVGGIVAGVLQWLVLRRQFDRAAWWVLASIMAAAIVGVAVFAVDVDGAFLALGGTVFGVLQWLVLRRQIPRAGWWVLASTVGWIVGGFMSGAFAGGFLGWATIGGVYGAITGAALVWLLRQPALEA